MNTGVNTLLVVPLSYSVLGMGFQEHFHSETHVQCCHISLERADEVALLSFRDRQQRISNFHMNHEISSRVRRESS